MQVGSVIYVEDNPVYIQAVVRKLRGGGGMFSGDEPPSPIPHIPPFSLPSPRNEEERAINEQAVFIAEQILKSLVECGEGCRDIPNRCAIEGTEDATEYVWRVTNACGQKNFELQKVHTDLTLRGRGMMSKVFDLIEPVADRLGYTLRVVDLGNQQLAKNLGVKRGYDVYDVAVRQAAGRVPLNVTDPELKAVARPEPEGMTLAQKIMAPKGSRTLVEFAEKRPAAPAPSEEDDDWILQ